MSLFSTLCQPQEGGGRGRWGHSEQVLSGESQEYRVGRVFWMWEEDERGSVEKGVGG